MHKLVLKQNLHWNETGYAFRLKFLENFCIKMIVHDNSKQYSKNISFNKTSL